MATHWTYGEFDPNADLQQGDILQPTEELKKVFKEVHPHFADEKYLSFLVITQSCDLVRREKECATRYINVAVVRSLAEVANRLIESVCAAVQPNIYSEKHRQKAEQLFERIFNQNEAKLGLFYLYPDAEVGLGEDAVAFLRVSVAFRCDHYETMIKARKGRLKTEFENKLGWLVGNLYARVGTTDWKPEELRKRREPYLSGVNGQTLSWVAEERLQQIKKDGHDPSKLPPDHVVNQKSFPIKTQKEIGLERVADIVKNVMHGTTPEQLEKLRMRLKNDQTLSATFRK
jgi:hypothetical protein